MPVTEGDRHRAFTKISETMGPDVANVLMELLPLRPATELVTQGDLLAATTRLQGEMAELRGEMAELRGEMAELRAELRGDLALQTAELRNEISRIYRWGAGVMAANAVAVITALVT